MFATNRSLTHHSPEDYSDSLLSQQKLERLTRICRYYQQCRLFMRLDFKMGEMGKKAHEATRW